FEQRQVQGNLRDLAGGEAGDDEAAAPADGAERGLGERSADRVEHDVDTTIAGEPLDFVAQIRGRVVDGVVGAMFAADGELLFARCAGDDRGADGLADFHGGEADAAGRA